jgi:phospholipid N-methyltransferase
MHSFDTFIGQSLKHFIKIGSVFPSSSFLARRMVQGIDSKVILELGPGTGVFTKEILKILPEDGLLISIESNESFVEYLNKNLHDARLKVYKADALQLGDILKQNGIDKVNCIISGLPLGHFTLEMKNNILSEIKNGLSDDGIYVQFEYFLAGIRSIKRFFPYVSISFELLNFPPAFVIRCKKNKK